MRLTTVTPESSEQLRDAVLEDFEVLAPGLHPVATALPIADAGLIDLLASDERGRLAVVSFFLEADAVAIARSIAQWDWATANRGLLRALLPVLGLDLSQEPRLLLVAGTVSDDARRLAARVIHPDLEIHEATLISADGARGVLLRRARVLRRMPEETGLDPALAGLPAGEARSLMRRILEELHDAGDGEGRLTPVGIEGGLDLVRDGRPVASLICAPEGVELRVLDSAGSLRITNDARCREAVRVLMTHPDSVAAEAAAFPAGDARLPVGAALTPEEIAEFGRLGSEPPGGARRGTVPAPPEPSSRRSPEEAEAGLGSDEPPGRDGAEPPPVRILKTGFMEN